MKLHKLIKDNDVSLTKPMLFTLDKRKKQFNLQAFSFYHTLDSVVFFVNKRGRDTILELFSNGRFEFSDAHYEGRRLNTF